VPGGYFMACGFNHGYFGIQELAGGDTRMTTTLGTVLERPAGNAAPTQWPKD
jgi:hypothetical protein